MIMKSRFAICLLCIGFNAVAWAERDSGKAHDLAEVHAQRELVGDDVKKLAQERSAQIEQLRRLEKQYGEHLNDLDKIKQEIRQQEQALQTVKEKIATTKQDLQRQRKSLEGLVKSAYAMGDKQGMDLLLNQRDPALSGRLLVYFDYMSKARVQKLKAIEEDVNQLQQLEAQKNTETQLLQVNLEKKLQETNELQLLKAQREALLSQIDHDYTDKQRQLANLIHDEKKLAALLASIQETDDNDRQLQAVPELEPQKAVSKTLKSVAPAKTIVPEIKQNTSKRAFTELQGQLPWPVQGSILERFGSRRFETTWDGVVIGAREGADIRAISSGKVVFADWLRGYGLLIIVDHGQNFMSLYAFNQSLHRSVGEFVNPGDRLASVGRSGGRSQASLYFGIRKSGRAIDPEKWCRKPGKG